MTSTQSTVDSAFEAALERVLRGEHTPDLTVDAGELHAARVVAGAITDLLPTAATRERALRIVRQRVAARSGTRAWWHLGPITMPAPQFRAVPIAVVLLIGMLVGGAYAIPVLLPQVFALIDPPAVEILQSGRAQDLRLTQTAAGITITADRAYADARRIVLQFTVVNPPDDPGQPSNQGIKVRSPLTTGGAVTLTDSAGRTYRHLRGAESPIISGASYNGEPLIGVYSFDASQIPPDAEQVSFQLTIAELRGVPGPTGVRQTVPGPWTFTFVVPVSR